MGLAAAYYAGKAGHDVQVLEAGAEPGGMAAHFDFDGLSIERFYHFICTSDEPTFTLLAELGLASALTWRRTSMGFFTGGRLHDWGDPVALLKFPEVSLIARLRYGLMAFVSTRRDRWDALETQTARQWITRWGGSEVYDRLWKRLLELKFHEHAGEVSAAWIWTRIKRLGRSRRSLFEEQLGYIEGGSQALIEALCEAIVAQGGRISLSTPALQVVEQGGRVRGVETADGVVAADAVISTVPTPLVAALAPSLPEAWKDRYRAIRNIGVCCVVLKLARSVTPHFWVNIDEPDIAAPGVIEFSNLRPLERTVVYVPYYMPASHPKFGWSDQDLTDEAFGYLQRLNPELRREDLLASRVGRLRHAQPICEPGFAARLPPLQTPIAGLQIADTCFYYPEDRGLAESVRLGRVLAAGVEAA